MKEIKLLTGLANIVSQVKNGEIKATFAYGKMKEFEKAMKESFKEIESLVKDELNNYKNDDFFLTIRKTYNFKENPEYVKKQEELKKIEDILKLATNMNEKGASYVDENGCVVEPVSVSYTEVLTYKPRKGI